MADLDPHDARTRFAAARVLRMATVTPAGAPHLVPATFAVRTVADGEEVLIAVDGKPKRHLALQRLRNLAAHPEVSLLVDRYDDDWSQLWWVRADGRAEVLEGAQREGPLDLLAARYPQYRTQRPAGAVIAVRVHRWRGWAFSPAAG